MAFPKELAARLNAVSPTSILAAGRQEYASIEQRFAAARTMPMRERAEHVFNRTMVLGCTAIALAGGLISGDQARPVKQTCPDGTVPYASANSAELSDAARIILEQPSPELVGSVNWSQADANIQPIPDCVVPDMSADRIA